MNAEDVVMAIRKFIKDNYAIVNVCGIICSSQDEALSNRHVDQLNNCEVDILRVSKTTAHNINADKKLMKSLDDYVSHHLDQDKCLLLLITGDGDFIKKVKEIRKKGYQVVLLYGCNTSKILKKCTTKSHSYKRIVSKFIEDKENLLEQIQVEQIEVNEPIEEGEKIEVNQPIEEGEQIEVNEPIEVDEQIEVESSFILHGNIRQIRLDSTTITLLILGIIIMVFSSY